MRVLLGLLLVPCAASAAEVTDAPPNLRGDLHLAYGGGLQQVGLAEDAATYGIRDVLRHDVDLAIDFAVYHGVGIHLGLPFTASRTLDYPSARTMLYEPVRDVGSYANGPALDAPPAFTGSGSRGVWLGVWGQPFREDWRRGLPADLRFDLAVRIPIAGQTLYDASRGVSPPGPALRVGGAFAVTRGAANPYLQLTYTAELAGEVEVVRPDGTPGATLALKDDSQFVVRGGSELAMWQDQARHQRVALDLFAGVTYHAPADRASGFWLPSVLPASVGQVVTQSEYLEVGGGIALDAHLGKVFGFRMGADGWYLSPHRLEHPYPVRTDAQSFEVRWRLDLVGRIRTKADRP